MKPKTYRFTILVTKASCSEALEEIGYRLSISQELGWLREHGVEVESIEEAE